MPNTDYTNYTDNRVVFNIWTDNVNAFCATTIFSNMQLWYCIAFQISVIELSFLVSFLAYFDSLILCADFVEVPTTMTTSFETVDASAGQPTQTLTSEMI